MLLWKIVYNNKLDKNNMSFSYKQFKSNINEWKILWKEVDCM